MDFRLHETAQRLLIPSMFLNQQTFSVFILFDPSVAFDKREAQWLCAWALESDFLASSPGCPTQWPRAGDFMDLEPVSLFVKWDQCLPPRLALNTSSLTDQTNYYLWSASQNTWPMVGAVWVSGTTEPSSRLWTSWHSLSLSSLALKISSDAALLRL